jgi:hypothetical protein
VAKLPAQMLSGALINALCAIVLADGSTKPVSSNKKVKSRFIGVKQLSEKSISSEGLRLFSNCCFPTAYKGVWNRKSFSGPDEGRCRMFS